MMEVQGLGCPAPTLQDELRIAAKLSLTLASSPNFAYSRPIIDAGIFVAELRHRETASDGANQCCFGRDNAMDLMIWVPATFLLGVGAMLLCYAFLIACENI